MSAGSALREPSPSRPSSRSQSRASSRASIRSVGAGSPSVSSDDPGKLPNNTHPHNVYSSSSVAHTRSVHTEPNVQHKAHDPAPASPAAEPRDDTAPLAAAHVRLALAHALQPRAHRRVLAGGGRPAGPSADVPRAGNADAAGHEETAADVELRDLVEHGGPGLAAAFAEKRRPQRRRYTRGCASGLFESS